MKNRSRKDPFPRKRRGRSRPITLLLAVCLLGLLLGAFSGCREIPGSDEGPAVPEEPGQVQPAETEVPSVTEPETEPEPETEVETEAETVPETEGSVRTCVMIGDSLTARGDFSKYFESAEMKNLGINGDTIAGVTERLVQAEEAAPDLLFILCGINSLSDRTKESCLEEYEALLTRADAMEGEPRIVIESVLPISRGWQEWKVCSDETVRAFNDGIRALAEAHGFEYLDLYGKYELCGAMDPDLTTDGLHLNESGYDIWPEELRPYIEG